MIAHVGGLPLEEVLPAFAGTSTALLLAHARGMLRTPRRRGSRR